MFSKAINLFLCGTPKRSVRSIQPVGVFLMFVRLFAYWFGFLLPKIQYYFSGRIARACMYVHAKSIRLPR